MIIKDSSCVLLGTLPDKTMLVGSSESHGGKLPLTDTSSSGRRGLPSIMRLSIRGLDVKRVPVVTFRTRFGGENARMLCEIER
jgi:hypothetical protein